MNLLPAELPAWLALTIPLALGLGALLVPARASLRWASHVALVGGALVLLLGLVAAFAKTAPASSFVRLDVVTAAMLCLVALLGVVVTRFSETYLAGEQGLRRYARALLVVLGAVTTLIITSHLAVMAIAWMATSLALNELLTFYPDRRPALVAAHKKFILSRLAEVALLVALGLIGLEAGTLQLDALTHFVEGQSSLSPMLHAASILIVVCVVLKSAQLPFHGWLTQVMEAPTPVSALLHAGVVNLGGVVLVRLAPLLTRAAGAMALLVCVGLITVVLAGLVMMTRVSIKLSLAWSTCAQLGFMLVQCGLGAWHLALLHLVAHSLYKAHAFLSAGTVVETWKLRAQAPARQPKLAWPLLAVALVAAGAVFLLFNGAGVVVPLSVSVALAFAPTLVERGLLLPGLWRLALTLALGISWHLLAGALVPTAGAAPNVGVLCLVVTAGLVCLAMAQLVMRARPDGVFARFLQPRLFAGFFLDEYFTRLTFRLWPPQFPATSTATLTTAEAR